MTTAKRKWLLGGIPTEPDVNRLFKEFPWESLKPGIVISYEAISRIIKTGPETSRFKTITGAWRRALENDYNIILKAGDPPKHFRVMTEGEKVGLSRGKLRGSARLVKRAAVINTGVVVDKLTEFELKEHDFNKHKTGAMAAMVLVRGKIALPKMNEKVRE